MEVVVVTCIRGVGGGTLELVSKGRIVVVEVSSIRGGVGGREVMEVTKGGGGEGEGGGRGEEGLC